VAADKWRVWKEYNSTAVRYPDKGGIVAWIAEAVATHPDRPAVQAGGECLSYHDLDARADWIASALAAAGVPPGSTVAVTSSRTVHPYAGLFGVLKAGCGYVPVDPEDPAERLRFILQDAGVRSVLVRSAELEQMAWVKRATEVRVITMDDVPVAPAAVYQPPRQRSPICYIIYTSGTTGQPKGVRITESSLVNFVNWFIEAHDMTAADRIAQAAPLTFDPSIQQIFPAWVSGACLLPVGEPELHDPVGLLQWLAVERVTVIDAVTAQWHHWRWAAERNSEVRSLPDLRWVVVGGETLYHQESRHWYEVIDSPALLRNVYGPTEATINASETVVDPALEHGRVPIGVPLPNYRLYAVDSGSNLCRLGVTGELVIAGLGVADGYQSAEATAKSFGELSLPDDATETAYWTGDLTKLVRDHTGRLVLHFLGRTDTQVKVRGFRIELEEVEAAAKRIAGVRDAAVQLRNGIPEQLVCFYAADPGTPVAEVRAHLARTLPAFQLPNLYLRLDLFPTTQNGKLDRKALSAELERTLQNRKPAGTAPGSELELRIADAWVEVLDLGAVSIDENFFALGGTSLLAVDLARALRRRGVPVRPTDIFAHSTVRGLAERYAEDDHREPLQKEPKECIG
jgi:amino acid adenylation domain-containing protein